MEGINMESSQQAEQVTLELLEGMQRGTMKRCVCGGEVKGI